VKDLDTALEEFALHPDGIPDARAQMAYAKAQKIANKWMELDDSLASAERDKRFMRWEDIINRTEEEERDYQLTKVIKFIAENLPELETKDFTFPPGDIITNIGHLSPDPLAMDGGIQFEDDSQGEGSSQGSSGEDQSSDEDSPPPLEQRCDAFQRIATPAAVLSAIS
jgi:hypothetical protein